MSHSAAQCAKNSMRLYWMSWPSTNTFLFLCLCLSGFFSSRVGRYGPNLKFLEKPKCIRFWARAWTESFEFFLYSLFYKKTHTLKSLNLHRFVWEDWPDWGVINVSHYVISLNILPTEIISLTSSGITWSSGERVFRPKVQSRRVGLTIWRL